MTWGSQEYKTHPEKTRFGREMVMVEGGEMGKPFHGFCLFQDDERPDVSRQKVIEFM